MVEEFYGKISRSGSNLSDSLEDKLTGDFFGTLRWGITQIGKASRRIKDCDSAHRKRELHKYKR